MKNMTAYALLFTIASIGIAETAYLIRKRTKLEKPFCPIGGDGCVSVLNSKYNKIIGIHNDVLGFLFYVIFIFIAAFLVLELPMVFFWISSARWMLIGATLFSIYLFYLQWKVIKAWCFWCLMSALTVIFMDIIVFVI